MFTTIHESVRLIQSEGVFAQLTIQEHDEARRYSITHKVWYGPSLAYQLEGLPVLEWDDAVLEYRQKMRVLDENHQRETQPEVEIPLAVFS